MNTRKPLCTVSTRLENDVISLPILLLFMLLILALKVNKELYISTYQMCVSGYWVNHKGLENGTHVLPLPAAQHSPGPPHLAHVRNSSHLPSTKDRGSRFMAGFLIVFHLFRKAVKPLLCTINNKIGPSVLISLLQDRGPWISHRKLSRETVACSKMHFSLQHY